MGLKIGVDHPMEENWRAVFVGSGGIFERHQGVSGRVKRVSAGRRFAEARNCLLAHLRAFCHNNSGAAASSN